MMEITIKFKGKDLTFGEWKENLDIDTFSLRRDCVPKIYGTYIEWGLDFRANGLHLFRNFQGQGEAAGLYSLSYVYDQMYPGISFKIDQKEEAKDNMEEFLNKYNSLKAFL